ncbi:MAG TPA: hypothetical protein VGI81_11490 [Tepidisphaeraceae bacterium]|jgi:hypothetical protein
MTVLSTLPPTIRSYLDDFVARRRRVALARAAGIALAAFLIWMLAWCVVDRFAHLPGGVRLAALFVGIVAAAARIAPALLALHRQIDCVAAAEEAERQDARFEQRLVTVTSRLLGAADYRGSDDILIRLVREVGEQVAAARAHRLIPLRPAVGPWAICLALALLGCALMKVPGLGMPALMGRFLNPLADIPPVTTTHLTVTPGNRDLVQSQPLTIEVQAEQLGDSPVTLHLNDDERNWTRVTMSPAGGNRFTFALASVDRDLRYYVTGGDARSPDRLIRVLRRPAVASFRIDYAYPAYTRLAPATVTNADGRIEAPAGTRVTLTVTATEPLKTALLGVNSERLLMPQEPDDRSAQVQFVVRSTGPYSLDLISTREVAGSGPAGMMIRAVPDLPPRVRLARGGDSLRLNPRDSVPVWYEALDDYGIKSLVVRAQVNGQAPIEAPVRLWGDPRHQQDVFNFDLATLPGLGVGDVVKLAMLATDTAGHLTESLPLQVIVSPHSIDLDAWERIGELRNAAQLAQSLAAQFEEAVKAQAEVGGQKDHASAASLSAESKADRALSAASQTATLLRQSLLRATTHGRAPQLAVALAGWIDAAEVSSAAADEAFRQGGVPGGAPAHVRDRLRAAAEQVRQLRSQLATVATGEQAGAVLADFENLQVARARPVPKDDASRRRRLRDTVERMRQDVTAEAGQIGLDEKSKDLADQLRARIRESNDVLSAARPVDFASACRQWAAQLRVDPQQRLGMESRLSAAAQAEAIRPDADLIRARDLELASRATGALCIAARAGAGTAPKPELFDRFVADVDAVRHAREVDKDPSKPAAAPTVQQARDAAVAAQRELISLAGDPLAGQATTVASTNPRGGGGSGGADERQKEAENLALQASAAAAGHQYVQAATIDGTLVRRLENAPRRETTAPAVEAEPAPSVDRVEHHRQAVQREMATAQQLDTLGKAEQDLAGEVNATEPSEAADQQRRVAERIAQVATQSREWTASFPPVSTTDANARERAAAEVLAAQEQLSSMPQALAAAQTAAADRREAAMRAGLARDAARAAPPDQRDAAARAAAEADQNALDAQARLTNALEPVSSHTADALAERLGPFAPETDAARAAILSQLEPALETLETAVQGGDVGFVDRSATDVRRAVEACQRDLALAQDALVQRDPLVAAKWYARAAVNSLSMMPPDLGSARAHQANASAAIWRAWDQSIHRAATERLSAIPSMAAVLGLPAPSAPGPGSQQGSRFAAAREWGRLRPQDAPDLNAALHDADPPGYEESLKLYFEALGKAQGAK